KPNRTSPTSKRGCGGLCSGCRRYDCRRRASCSAWCRWQKRRASCSSAPTKRTRSYPGRSPWTTSTGSWTRCWRSIMGELEEGRLRRVMTGFARLEHRVAELETERSQPIAIVSIGCRLPGGVETPDDFWRLLTEARDVIEPLPRRWDRYDVYNPDPDAPGK